MRFTLLPGQRHDMLGVKPLISGLEFDRFLADKAFDANWLRGELDERGTDAVIPSKANRTDESYVANWNLTAAIIAAR